MPQSTSLNSPDGPIMSFLLLLTVLLTFVSAEAKHKYTPPKYPPPVTYPGQTCPASTPFTTIFVTSKPTKITSVIETHVTVTLPTTYTLSRQCPTFYSPTDKPNPATSCAYDTKTCIVPACLKIESVTVPCETDTCCGGVPTVTTYPPCPTACPTGCGGTSYQVIQPPCASPAPPPGNPYPY